MPKRIVLGFLLLVLFAWPALADEIYLKNKRSIVGRITKVTKTEVTIQIGDIGSMTIKRSEIERIEFTDADGSEYLKKWEDPDSIEEEKETPEKKPEASPREKEEPEPEPEPEKMEEKEVAEEDKPLPDPTPEEQKAIDKYVYQLGHKTMGYRNTAKSELVKMGPKTLKTLFTALTPGQSRRAQHAAMTIAEIGDKRAAMPLVKAMKSNTEKWPRKEMNAALEKIMGKDMGFEADDSVSDQNRAIRKWEDYLKKLEEEKKKKKEEEKKKKEKEKKKAEEKEGAKPG